MQNGDRKNEGELVVERGPKIKNKSLVGYVTPNWHLHFMGFGVLWHDEIYRSKKMCPEGKKVRITVEEIT